MSMNEEVNPSRPGPRQKAVAVVLCVATWALLAWWCIEEMRYLLACKLLAGLVGAVVGVVCGAAFARGFRWLVSRRAGRF
jgi:hypothetical protein